MTSKRGQVATEFTLEELSKLTGESLERLGAWQARGLIGEGDGDQFDQRDGARAEMIRDLLRLGIEMDAIVEAFGEPDSEFRHFLERCAVDFSRPTYSVGQAAELTGLEIEQLRRLMEAMGIHGAGDALDDEDLEALRSSKVALDTGYSEDGLLQLLRVYADTLGRAADATQRTTHFYMYDRMRAAGVSESEAGERMDAAGETLDPLVEPALLYFFRKAMARAQREDTLLHLTEELGPREHGDVLGQFQAAIVFVDLSSFSPLAEAMGDVTAAEVLQRFASLVRMSAEQHQGRGVKQIGDGFMLVFPDARSAIACSLDIDTKAQEESQFPALRSGVHWGPVLYREGDYVGATVNLASRLVGVAEPHTVLVTSAVRQATAGLAGLEFVRLGKRRLKGLATEEVLFEVRLEGAIGAEKVLDPVCRMELGSEEIAARLSLEGEERAFCSDDCLRKFVADPKRYSSAPSSSVASTG